MFLQFKYKDIDRKLESLINAKDSMYINDPGITSIWDEMFDLLSQDENKTIVYLLGVSDKNKMSEISSVFDELYLYFQSDNFTLCLNYIKKRFPKSSFIVTIDNLIENY